MIITCSAWNYFGALFLELLGYVFIIGRFISASNIYIFCSRDTGLNKIQNFYYLAF